MHINHNHEQPNIKTTFNPKLPSITKENHFQSTFHSKYPFNFSQKQTDPIFFQYHHKKPNNVQPMIPFLPYSRNNKLSNSHCSQVFIPKIHFDTHSLYKSPDHNRNKPKFKKFKIPKQTIDSMFQSNKEVNNNKLQEKKIQPKRKLSQTINIICAKVPNKSITSRNEENNNTENDNANKDNDNMFLTKMSFKGYKKKDNKKEKQNLYGNTKYKLNMKENFNFEYLLNLIRETNEQITQEQNDLDDMIQTTRDTHVKITSLTQNNFAKGIQRKK